MTLLEKEKVDLLKHQYKANQPETGADYQVQHNITYTDNNTLTASSAALQATTVAAISPVCPTMSLFGRLTRTFKNKHYKN